MWKAWQQLPYLCVSNLGLHRGCKEQARCQASRSDALQDALVRPEVAENEKPSARDMLASPALTLATFSNCSPRKSKLSSSPICRSIWALQGAHSGALLTGWLKG